MRFEVLERLVGYHLRRASGVFNVDFARTLGESGMRPVLFSILSVIEASPGINQGSIGRALSIQRANMVSLINELVDRGLIHRDASTDDRRALALTLTEKGHDAYRESLERIQVHEDRLLIDLSAAERATLIALLRRIEAQEPLELGP